MFESKLVNWQYTTDLDLCRLTTYSIVSNWNCTAINSLPSVFQLKISQLVPCLTTMFCLMFHIRPLTFQLTSHPEEEYDRRCLRDTVSQGWRPKCAQPNVVWLHSRPPSRNHSGHVEQHRDSCFYASRYPQGPMGQIWIGPTNAHADGVGYKKCESHKGHVHPFE